MVSDELDEFARVVMDSEPLHNVLSDIAIPASARRGVVHDLLQAKAAAETSQLVSWAVLVENAADLPSAVFDLIELAHEVADAADAGRTRSVSDEELLGGRTADFASTSGVMPTGCSKRPTGERPSTSSRTRW